MASASARPACRREERCRVRVVTADLSGLQWPDRPLRGRTAQRAKRVTACLFWLLLSSVLASSVT